MAANSIASEQLAQWQALCDKATPGPWEWDTEELLPGHIAPHFLKAQDEIVVGYWVNYAEDSGMDVGDEDAAFIAAAREAVPLLLAEVARLKGIIQRAYDAMESVKEDSEATVLVCEILEEDNPVDNTAN